MRIISKEYDYYDQFSDKTSRIIYKRCGQEFDESTPGFLAGINIDVLHSKPFANTKHWRNERLLRHTLNTAEFGKKWVSSNSAEYFWLLIAGKLYPGLRLFVESYGRHKVATHQTVYDLYSAKAVLKLLTSKVKFRGSGMGEIFSIAEVAAELGKYFSTTINFDRACAIHLHYDSPLISLKASGNDNSICHVMVDPSLKGLSFHKELNPFLLFQELSQFMGTVMVKEENTPSKLTDLDKVKQHGFDKKKSFRNM